MRNLLFYRVSAYCVFLLSVMSVSAQAQTRYVLTEGNVVFLSDAPLERITATSKSIRGVVDPNARTFAFTIDITTFQGFNSPLQRVHFNENYMESGMYPTATFKGKFIEDIDLLANGTYEVRVKGNLVIHGVEKERILKGSLKIDNGNMEILSNFTVLLEDHDIRIPRVVYQKIAQVVTVDVHATLNARKS